MKKVILSLISIIIGLSFLVGCGGNKYNAVLYSHAENWISEEFLDENRVKAYYPNKDYVEGESDPGEFLCDLVSTLPEGTCRGAEDALAEV